MRKSKWLDEVALALRRQGLSTAYIRRFTDELADHCEDLSQEKTSMDASPLTARLGTADELAIRAAQELRRRTYAGRHPLITFVAAPLPTALLLLVGLFLILMLVGSAASEVMAGDDDRISTWAVAAIQINVWAMRYIPFIAGAILFCHLAKRTLCGPRWSLIACALCALFAGLFAINLTLPTNDPGSGALVMGFVIPPGPAQIPQALAPLTIWLLYTGREFRRRDPVAAA